MTPARSDHFNGKTFFQSHHTVLRMRDFWRWRLFHRPKRWPKTVALPPVAPPPTPQADQIVVTWIGHASFLVQSTRGNLLIDPVFSERASPVTWAGPRRVHPPGIAFDALPPIDTVLLSHDHYDHCDAATIRRLAEQHRPKFVAPLRHADLLAQSGSDRGRIMELDWWEAATVAPDFMVTLTPTKHWSNRFGSERNFRLWGGFFCALGAKRLWFAGDSGYDREIFTGIRRRLGSPDLALLPIGAYEPQWFMSPMHMNPAEAVQAHRDIGAQQSVAMHWGTFQLTDEGRDEPVAALATALQEAHIPAEQFRALNPGESVVA